MNASALSQIYLRISYWVFFIAITTIALFLVAASKVVGDINPIPFGFVFAVALIWQLFTLYHNRHHFLTWILAVLYSIPAGLLLIYVLKILA